MRIVVKIGSNVLTRPDGRLSIAHIAALVEEVAALYEAGHRVMVVTSGAVAAGCAQISLPPVIDRVIRRQVLSAVGQPSLMDTYRTCFATTGLPMGQILVTKSDFADRDHSENIRQCITALLDHGVIPVINENDAVSVESLMFTDNDELSGQVARLFNVDLVVILSSVDGLYTGDPADPASELIREVRPGEDRSGGVVRSTSSKGRGGMTTKLSVTSALAREGIACAVANGNRPGVLKAVVFGDPPDFPCTRFLPAERRG